MARRTREQWLGLFEAQVESGLSAAEFCRGQGINPNYFCQRKAHFGRDRQAARENPVGFVELKRPLAAAGRVEVRFGEVSLSLPAGASPSWVATVMRELGRAPV